MLAKPDIILTIHGVGEHEAGEVGRKLASGLGAGADDVKIRDFNWCEAVDKYGGDHIAELSGSIETANSQSVKGAAFLRFCTNLVEAFWGFTFLFAGALPVVFAPTLVLYFLLPEFSFFATRAPKAIWNLWLGLLFAATIGFGSLIIISLLLGVVRQRVLAFWTLRRALLIALRPPLALLFWVSTLDDFLKSVGRSGFYLIAFNIGGFVFGQAVGWLFGTGWDVDHALRMLFVASSFVGAALVLGALFGVAARAFAAPLKFFRDVFNYVGSPSTRALIQKKLTEFTKTLPRNSRVAIAGHSLGSVIALDSLVNTDAWRRCDSVTLVTGGSPIARWFARFFPDLFFPRRSDRMTASMVGHSPVVAWINVFRPRDPVGASLDLPDTPYTVDSETDRADLKGIRAHAAYWSAEDVHARVLDAWATLSPYEGARDACFEVPVEIPPSPVAGLLSGLQVPVLVAATLAGIVLGLSSYFSAVDEQLKTNREFVQDALAEGGRAVAEVTHRQRYRPAGEASYPVQKFTFRFEKSPGAELTEVALTEVEGNPLSCCQLFDPTTLLELYRPDDDLDDESTFTARVAFLDDVDKKVAIPGFPPTVIEIRWYHHLSFMVGYAFFGLIGLGLSLAFSVKLMELLAPGATSEAGK